MDDPNESVFGDLVEHVRVQDGGTQRAVNAILLSHHEINAMPIEARIAAVARLASQARGRAEAPWTRLEVLHGSDTHLWVAEFALRSSSALRELAGWAGPDLRDGFNVLVNWRLFVRTARCLVLASLIGKSRRTFPASFPEWQWTRG